jgi:hypothetical protein
VTPTIRFAQKFSLPLAILAVLTVSHAAAYPVLTWNLQDVVFASGETAQGSFTLQGWDLLDWNIRVSGGTNPVLTNFSFQPGTDCLVFCGLVLSFRTALAPDQTFHSLNLYLYDPNDISAPYSELFSGDLSTVRLNSNSDLSYDRLIDPTTVGSLAFDDLAATATDARVELAPEPVTALMSVLGIGALLGLRALRRKLPGHWALGDVEDPKEPRLHQVGSGSTRTFRRHPGELRPNHCPRCS